MLEKYWLRYNGRLLNTAENIECVKNLRSLMSSAINKQCANNCCLPTQVRLRTHFLKFTVNSWNSRSPKQSACGHSI